MFSCCFHSVKVHFLKDVFSPYVNYKILAVQSGKCGSSIFCCPIPWLLGEGDKIYLWTNQSLRVLLIFIFQDNGFLFLFFFLLFTILHKNWGAGRGDFVCPDCQLKSRSHSSQLSPAQRTAPVCTNSAASLADKFSYCYPVFPALLLNPCFIIVCYFLLAVPTVH